MFLTLKTSVYASLRLVVGFSSQVYRWKHVQSLVGRKLLMRRDECQLALSSCYGVGVPEHVVEQFSDSQERSNAISHAMLPDPPCPCVCGMDLQPRVAAHFRLSGHAIGRSSDLWRIIATCIISGAHPPFPCIQRAKLLFSLDGNHSFAPAASSTRAARYHTSSSKMRH